ncbi:MAG: hypothetical protein Q8L90_06910 [Bacteroidota bacterium]|nr:hypothetical protein [Bacteroidota bacterium]
MKISDDTKKMWGQALLNGLVVGMSIFIILSIYDKIKKNKENKLNSENK